MRRRPSSLLQALLHPCICRTSGSLGCRDGRSLDRQFGRTKITADKDLVGQVKAGHRNQPSRDLQGPAPHTGHGLVAQRRVGRGWRTCDGRVMEPLGKVAD